MSVYKFTKELTTHQFSNHEICKILSGPQHHQKYVISDNHFQGVLLQIQAGSYERNAYQVANPYFSWSYSNDYTPEFSMDSKMGGKLRISIKIVILKDKTCYKCQCIMSELVHVQWSMRNAYGIFGAQPPGLSRQPTLLSKICQTEIWFLLFNNHLWHVLFWNRLTFFHYEKA